MRLPWIAAAGILLLLASGALLDALSGHGTGLAFAVVWSSAALVSTGFGLVVALRRPENPIGWLLLANGARARGDGVRERRYADYAVLGHPGSLPGGAWAVLLSRSRLAAAVRLRHGDRLGVPRRPAPLAALAALVAVARRLSFAVLIVVLAAGRRALQRPVRPTSPSPLPELSDVVIGIPLALTCGLGALAALVAGAVAIADTTAARVGRRAPPAASGSPTRRR